MMQNNKESERIVFKPVLKVIILILISFVVVGALAVILYGPNESQVEIEELGPDVVENGIHVRTGLVDAEGLQTVITNCTSCHSSQLIIQNRMGEEQWNATIRWMQKTQGLWPLGDNQKIIVDYLVKNYPPLEKGRRPALTRIDWYNHDE
ncbi:monoheme cytochrome C [Maribacter sp. LLG6340-A2]|uniref:monoheme cytochrome C n=1 Tax=Maribacter sp. LLG6340-A2 TaxID=3160834 RepID=UPI0038648B69